MAKKDRRQYNDEPTGLGDWGHMPIGARRTGSQTQQVPRKPLFGLMARGYFDMPMFVLVIVLLSFGLVMLYSASNVYALQYYGNSAHFIMKQLLFGAVGILAMLLISCIDYRVLYKLALPLYFLGLGLLIVVLIMPSMKGTHRWINLGFTTFQPSEVMKFCLVVIFAKLIEYHNARMKTFRYGVLLFVLLLIPVVGLLLLEPHMSAIVLVTGIAMIMMFVGGTRLFYFAALIMTAGAGLAAFVLSGKIEYMLARVQYWIDPFSDPLGDGYQTIQSLYAIGSGGFWGLGLGNSRQKHLYLPEPQNDFIFAVVCEELGFLGGMIVITLFALLVWRGFKIALRAKDKFGSMLVIGLTVQVGLQAFLNMSVVTNLIPNTGISMPFFSYGGTSLMMLLAQMGVILAVSRSCAMGKTLKTL